MNPFRYLRDGARWLRDPYRFLDEAQRRFGLTFRVRLPVLGDILMTGDPQLVAEIIQHKDLDAGKSIVPALEAILGGRSVIMLEGKKHAARHRLIASFFRGESLAGYDELTVRVTRAELNNLPPNKTFNAYDLLRGIGRRIIVAAMFGPDSAVAGAAEQSVANLLTSFQNPLVLFLAPLHVDAGAWSPWGRALRNRRTLCELIRQEIRACGKSGAGSSILERLVAGAAGELDEEELVEEVLSLLLLGHDTAAATMAWAFMHFYRDPALVKRIRAEAQEATAGAAAPVSPDALPLLEACIKESMRLCPVVVHVGRSAQADLQLGNFPVRRGEKVIPCTYLAQHNAAVFPEPHAFRPERFLNGQRYEHAFFPFGFGHRICVGKPFAMRQMLLVVATAMQAADLELEPGYRLTPTRRLLLIVPRNGPPMRNK